MMLSDADFDELFAPAQRADKPPGAMPPRRAYAADPARTDDEDGRVPPASPRGDDTAMRRRRAAAPALAGIAFAMMPAFAAYGAASAMLARRAQGSHNG